MLQQSYNLIWIHEFIVRNYEGYTAMGCETSKNDAFAIPRDQ